MDAGSRQTGDEVRTRLAGTGRGGGAASHQENYIAWEQIEPLVRPGMTGRELALAILARAELPYPVYRLRMYGRSHLPLMEAMRAGVYVVKYDPAFTHDTWADETIA